VLIEILVTPDCPHTESALALVDQAARQLDLEPIVDLIEISTVEQAEDHDFIGSPTIRVNGRDVADGTGGRPPSISCRLYRSGERTANLPGVILITGAIRAAAACPGPLGRLRRQ